MPILTTVARTMTDRGPWIARSGGRGSRQRCPPDRHRRLGAASGPHVRLLVGGRADVGSLSRQPVGEAYAVARHSNAFRSLLGLGGKQHIRPCHHSLAEALPAYVDAAGIGEDRKGFLFRTSRGNGGAVLSEHPMKQPDAWRMIRRRAAAAGIPTRIGNHSFRATGITAYLKKRRHAREGCRHGQPRQHADNPALRSPTGRDKAR